MRRSPAVIFLLLIALTATSQTINLHGKVSSQTGDPIADAVVTLVGQDFSDTTGSDGMYAIAATGIGQTPLLTPRYKDITLEI